MLPLRYAYYYIHQYQNNLSLSVFFAAAQFCWHNIHFMIFSHPQWRRSHVRHCIPMLLFLMIWFKDFSMSADWTILFYISINILACSLIFSLSISMWLLFIFPSTNVVILYYFFFTNKIYDIALRFVFLLSSFIFKCIQFKYHHSLQLLSIDCDT